jgi:AcrR family transcriptional regulator
MTDAFHPRKQPKQERARFTVDAILDAVARIVAGDEGRLTTNLAAKLAGVSVGSLYQYFPSKQALIAALVGRAMRARAALVREQIEASRELPLPILARRLVDAVIDARSDDRLERALFEIYLRLRDTDLIRALDAELYRITRDALESLSPRIREVDTEVVSYVLVHALRGVLTAAALDRPGLLRSEAFRHELATLLASYLEPPR